MKSEDNQQKAVNAQVSINSKIKFLDYDACIDALVTINSQQNIPHLNSHFKSDFSNYTNNYSYLVRKKFYCLSLTLKSIKFNLNIFFYLYTELFLSRRL